MGLAVLEERPTWIFVVTLRNQSICYAAEVWGWYFVGVSIRVHMAQRPVTPNKAGSSPAPRPSIERYVREQEITAGGVPSSEACAS
jgi:hypothetical protein